MKTQRGLSLVELMISIALGLLLMVGLGTVFFSMKQTSSLRQGLSALQNNERMAMMFLKTSIQTAGYYPNPLAPSPVTQAISGTGTGAAGADTLSVSFVASTGATSSQGCSAALTSGDQYTDVFSISGGNLVCTETDTTAGTAPVAYTLVSGLSGMNIHYGVDPTCSGSVTEYVNAAGVTGAVCSAPLGAQLKTVNVSLIFTNPLAGSAGQPQTVTIAQTIPYMNGL